MDDSFGGESGHGTPCPYGASLSMRLRQAGSQRAVPLPVQNQINDKELARLVAF